MKKITLASLFLALCLTSFAQKNNDEDDRLDEMIDDKIEYIQNKMGLTPEEAEKFVPLYKKYIEERFLTYEKSPLDNIDIHEKKNKKLSEEEYKKINEKFINGKINKALSTKLYYEKFQEILPESKIYKLYMAERSYKYELLKKVQNKGSNTSNSK
ncbi:MAG: hypothetical protein M0P12_10355 [Paludibacteraceae bacterium]|nr:hypothetical protein [Paludibacteraceae bacterium]